MWAIERWLVRRLLRAIGSPPVALVLWDGEAVGPPAARFRVKIHDRRTYWQLLANVYLNFGDAFSDGRIEVEGDLEEFLEIIYRAEDARPRGGLAALAEWCRRPRVNSLRDSRSNVYHHYDIGDDFYRLWLDREMLYTCAYFPSPEVSLEEAQTAKMDLICRKLWLKPGETVVEAGCGWGGFALHMARNYGVTVKAYNISREQVRTARERAKAAGLESQVEFIEDDYRAVRGQFDVFASVGMLEHVGAKCYHELGEVIHRCLRPAGRGILHTIGRDYPGELNAWIKRRIFPGAYAPPCGKSWTSSSRGRSRCSTWRTCGCITPSRCSIGTTGSRPPPSGSRRCSTRPLSAPGGCISSARWPPSAPAACNSSRCSSHGTARTRSLGREGSNANR